MSNRCSYPRVDLSSNSISWTTSGSSETAQWTPLWTALTRSSCGCKLWMSCYCETGIFSWKKNINPCVIPNSLEDLGRFLYRNPPELCLLCVPKPSRTHQPSPEPCLQSAPQPSGTSSAICTRTLRNLISHLHRNPPELCLLCVPESSGTSSAIAGTVSGTSSAICTGTRQNLVCYLHRNHPEPSGSSSAICAGTVGNLISFLPRNPLEPHQLSAPERSGTFRNPPERSPEPRVAAAPDRTRAILGCRPHSKFCCWGIKLLFGKNMSYRYLPTTESRKKKQRLPTNPTCLFSALELTPKAKIWKPRCCPERSSSELTWMELPNLPEPSPERPRFSPHGESFFFNLIIRYVHHQFQIAQVHKCIYVCQNILNIIYNNN